MMRYGPTICRRRRLTALLVAAAIVLTNPLTAPGAGAATDDPAGSTAPTPPMSTSSTTSVVAPTTMVARTDPDSGSSGGWVEVFAATPASGSALGVRGGVFAPASTVEIWFPERDLRLATTTADLDGEIAEQVALPIVVPGNYEIQLLGTDPDGAPVDVATEVAIAEESVVREPITGTEVVSDAAPVLIVGLILGGMLIARRTARKVRELENE
jgi:hypothetical protein